MDVVIENDAYCFEIDVFGKRIKSDFLFDSIW